MATLSSITLDDLEHLEVDNAAPVESHLSYPKPSVPLVPERQGPVEQPKRLLTDRLYIGNLHPTVDEYTLLRVFNKFGKVTKLDFLFHKAGPMKGKPRGYAFIEYGSDDEARKALVMAHDKLLRGRRITVTHAQQAPLDQYGNYTGPSGHRKGALDNSRPTAISLLKSGGHSRQEAGTSQKIAMMEAKLRQLEAEKALAANPPRPTLPFNPSLPLKPATPLPSALTVPADGPQHRKPERPPNLLSLAVAPTPSKSQGTEAKPKVAQTKNKLTGVVIKKTKLKRVGESVQSKESTPVTDSTPS
ncbi:hypothetical protein NMY22_g15970 [Coprinellus aureogranulatus]|nr:hypothetical protein NMY22_g15970 [Coprinellus aureogranulatus]